MSTPRRSVLVIAAVLALAGTSVDSAAQETAWKRLGGPPGGLGYDIRYNFADPNMWYVTDAHSGVHVSFDNGLTWESANTGIEKEGGPAGDWRAVFCLTVDENDPDIVWAGTDNFGKIYRSTDRGLTWQRRDTGITIEYDALTWRGFTVEPGNSNVVYAMGESLDEAAGGPNPEQRRRRGRYSYGRRRRQLGEDLGRRNAIKPGTLPVARLRRAGRRLRIHRHLRPRGGGRGRSVDRGRTFGAGSACSS